jgi:hypothetical protein
LKPRSCSFLSLSGSDPMIRGWQGGGYYWWHSVTQGNCSFLTETHGGSLSILLLTPRRVPSLERRDTTYFFQVCISFPEPGDYGAKIHFVWTSCCYGSQDLPLPCTHAQIQQTLSQPVRSKPTSSVLRCH